MHKDTDTRILVIEDHPMMRKGLVYTLESEPGYEVVLQTERAEEALKALDDYQFDLIVADISLPGMNGLEFVKNALFQSPDLKILLVSRHDEALYAERALRAGAKGYIMKFEPGETLLKATRKILSGSIYVSDDINEKIIMGMMHGKENMYESPIHVLSDRELEVFELIGHGKSSSEIANQLHLAAKTIETYRSRIKEKLGYKNATEMMFHAVKWVENAKSDSI